MNGFPIFNLLIVLLSIVLSETWAACPTIISKSEWGGRPAKRIEYTIKPLKYVIIHHTVTPKCLTKSACSERLVNIQSFHMNDLDFDDIGYNFMVGGDGNIYEGAGWHKLGAHTYGYNRKSIGIVFVGDFRNEAPNENQLEAGKKLIECGVELGELDARYKLLGAKSVSSTESPGAALFEKIKSWKGFTTIP